MYRSILVPLDGSAFGEQALPLALAIARRAGAAVQLVHVHTAFVYVESGFIYDNTADRHIRQQEQGYLEDAVKRWGSAAGGVPLSGALRDGRVADAVQEQLAHTGADLIVLTTHGRGPLSRFWLGSVADELIRRASSPVLVVPARETAPDPTKEPLVRHVVIPLDGSTLAEQALEPAVALGRLLGADFSLLQVVRPVFFPGHDPTMGGFPAMGQPATHELQAAAHSYLDGVAQRLRARSLKVQTRVVVDTHPAVAILDQSTDRPEGLIALATHGRSGLPRALLGSIADKVVRGSTVPVLLCRPPRG
jgi:nucleotide-binding universal stress UspA family protein